MKTKAQAKSRTTMKLNSKTKTKATRSKTKVSASKKLSFARFPHRILVPILIILAIASVGTYRVVASQAATLAVPDQYVARVANENGCWLAGRKWVDNDCMGGANMVGTNKPCRVNDTVYKTHAGSDGTTRGYCTEAVAVASNKPTELNADMKHCVNDLHRMFIYELGCARKVNQENSNNARQCIGNINNKVADTDPYRRYVNYIAENGVDRCVEDKIAPTPPSTSGPATDAIAEPNCSALGRVRSASACKRECLPDAGTLLIDSTTTPTHVATNIYYCNKSVASTISEARCGQLHRLWLRAGCARRPDQLDNARDLIHCVSGYPYYRSNSEASLSGKLDVCERDKAAADANESAGIVGTQADGTTPIYVCKNGQIKQADGTCACPAGETMINGSCGIGDQNHNCPINSIWNNDQQQCVCTANNQPPQDYRCPDPIPDPPIDPGDPVTLEEGISERDCTQLYGRGWEQGKFEDGTLGTGCSRDTCANPAIKDLISVRQGTSSPYCKGYAQQIEKAKCTVLHRKWIDSAEACAQSPKQSKPRALTGAVQCAGGQYKTYLIRTGKADECVTTTKANQIKYIVSKFDVPFNKVAKLGPKAFCNTVHRKSYHWVASTGKCVKDRTLDDSGGGSINKVVVFIEENHSLEQMKQDMPYAFSQAKKYGYATNFEAFTHPSLPNYIVMAAGSPLGVTDDQPPAGHHLQGPSIFGKVVASGKTAKIYADGMDGNCSTDREHGRYVARHNPWTYFVDERDQCQKFDVPFAGNFDKDVKAGKLPNISMVIPDNCNNAHDQGCSLGRADDWFKKRLQTIYDSPDWKSGRLAVVLTADEDEGEGKNIVLTAVMHPSLDGKVVDSHLTHASLHKFMAEVAGIAPLRDAKDAPSMMKAFKLGSDGNNGGAPLGSADFRVATFNVLGAAHTDGPNANAPHHASYGPRFDRAIKIFNDNQIDVIGVQEFEEPQFRILNQKYGDKFDTYPRQADYGGGGASVNSVIWRKSKFEFVNGGTNNFFYFGHSKRDYPWVKLRDKETGRTVIFSNTHDPADTRGHAAAIRHEDAVLHLKDMQQLMKDGTPVVFVGDFNARSEINEKTAYFTHDRNKLAYCILQSTGQLKNAYDAWKNRGGNGKCPPPTNSVSIDQIYVSKNADVKKYVMLENADIRFATDHKHIVYADVILR